MEDERLNKVQERLLTEVLENEEKLNDWESGFIDKLYNLDPSIALSTGPNSQNAKLNEIHQKVVFNR